MEDCSIGQSAVVWVQKPNFGSLNVAASRSYSTSSWLCCGPPEFLSFSNCAWLPNCLIDFSLMLLSIGRVNYGTIFLRVNRVYLSLLYSPPLHVFLSCSIVIPLGHAHEAPDGVKRHRWLHPPLLIRQLFIPEMKTFRHELLNREDVFRFRFKHMVPRDLRALELWSVHRAFSATPLFLFTFGDTIN